MIFTAGFCSLKGQRVIELRALYPVKSPDPGGALLASLDSPLDSPRLEELLKGWRDVVIVVPDTTRPDCWLPLFEVLTGRFRRLKGARIIVATGLHRGITREERGRLSGSMGVDPGLIESHSPDEAVPAGVIVTERAKIALHFNRSLLEGDGIISFGMIELHQYAGFSGGYKTCVIGCGGEGTISAFHGLPFIRSPLTAPGNILGNPFQEALRLAGSRMRPIFCINVAAASGHGVSALFSGDPASVIRRGAEYLTPSSFSPIANPLDFLILNLHGEKGVNLYQASRGATYCIFTGRSALKEGGAVILDAPCPEGFGTGEGGRNFERAIRGGRRWFEEISRGERPLKGGEQRAYLLHRFIEKGRLILVGAQDPEPFQEAGIETAESIETALEILYRGKGGMLGGYVENPFVTIPVIGGGGRSK